jgi:hypothetical protein
MKINLPSPTPSTFIKILHHPHSLVSEPTIVPLEGEDVRNTAPVSPVFVQQANDEPWAPFCNRSDFEYMETAIQGLLNRKIVDAQLRGINHDWAGDSNITFRSHADMEKSLAAARTYDVEVSNCITCIEGSSESHQPVHFAVYD